MKKMTVLSVVAASLLLLGCGEEKAVETEAAQPAKTETVAEKATTAVEAVKDVATAAAAKTAEVATEAKETVAEKATAAVESTKEAASAVAQKATAAVESTKEAASAVAEKATEAVAAATTSEAPAAFKACAGCHGAKGEKKALGKSAVIAGQAKADLVTKMNGYKAGTLNVAGMGGLMKGQMAPLSDADIDAVATYVSGL